MSGTGNPPETTQAVLSQDLVERKYCVVKSKGGYHYNIDFWVPKESEHVLEKNCITSSRIIKKGCLSMPIR
jgi:hypothetical protein